MSDSAPASARVDTVAYLTNQYPKVSHAFIRRELLQMEAAGVTVHRYSVRPTPDQLVDEGDIAENDKTKIILQEGAVGLLLAMIAVFVQDSGRFIDVLREAWRIGYRSDRGRLLHIVYFAEACVLKRWAERDGVQHIHVHFGTNPTTVAMLCRMLGGPRYSFTVHGPDEFDKATILSLRDKIHHSAFTVAITEFCRSQLYRWSDYGDWSKIQVVRCGLDSKFLGEAVQPAPDVPTFVCVGRLCEQKGQILLVRAAAQLKTRGRRFKLVFVGDGEMRKDVEAVVDAHDMHAEVEITGWASSDEVKRRLLDCRALALPSFAEGLPAVIQEAFALGRPTISTYIAGIPELVTDGETGWLVFAGDEPSLVDAMEKCLDTPIETIHAMGQRAQDAAAAAHDVRTEAGKLLGHIRDAAQAG